MKEERSRILVSRFQSGLYRRVLAYWLIAVVSLWNFLFVWRLLEEGKGDPLDQIVRFCGDFYPVLICFAIVCVFLYNPNGKQSLLDFALSIMAFTSSGMLAVFLAALLTGRGNFRSVVGALITGAMVVAMLQPPVMAWWTARFFHHRWALNGQWDMPLALIPAFLVCVAGSPRPWERELKEAKSFDVAPAATEARSSR